MLLLLWNLLTSLILVPKTLVLFAALLRIIDTLIDLVLSISLVLTLEQCNTMFFSWSCCWKPSFNFRIWIIECECSTDACLMVDDIVCAVDMAESLRLSDIWKNPYGRGLPDAHYQYPPLSLAEYVWHGAGFTRRLRLRLALLRHSKWTTVHIARIAASHGGRTDLLAAFAASSLAANQG
jgi:hypothetical protein